MQGESFLQHFVQSSHRYFHAVFQTLEVKLRMVRERVCHKGRKVDASQQAASSSRKRLLRAGVDSGVGELLCVAEKVPALNAVPEQSARLCIVPVCLRDLAEQVSGIYLLLDDLPCGLPCIVEQIVLVLLDCLHEVLVDAD